MADSTFNTRAYEFLSCAKHNGLETYRHKSHRSEEKKVNMIYRNVITPFLCLFCISLPLLSIAKDNQAFTLEGDTIQSVQTAIKYHKLTCVQLIRLYLNRIKKYDLALNRGTPINAFTNINPSVLTEAQKLDDYFNETGKMIGPLHCIPVIVKDNIDSVDSTSTSGSLSLLGSQPIKKRIFC